MDDEIIDLDDEEPRRIIRKNRTRARFSKREITELFISVVVVSFAFSFIFAEDMMFLLKGEVAPLVISFIAVGLGLSLHELGHKFMAQRYGLLAEFRMYKEGLMLALILVIASGGSFIFAAPGAVYISNIYGFRIPRSVDGITSLIGPVVNIFLGIIFFIGLMVSAIAGIGGFLLDLCIYGLIINLWLAFFNMIPFPPLDGHAVMKWNPLIWGIVTVPLFLGFIFLLF